MEFKAGDRVKVESESIGRPPRTGVIVEVVHGAPSPRYRVSWDDEHESIYTGYALRVGCRCAMCADEISGNTRLREESISKDVRPLSIDPVGRYAIRFQWSDGHSTGIYTFELLRELCPCPICAEKSEAQTR